MQRDMLFFHIETEENKIIANELQGGSIINLCGLLQGEG